MKRSIIKAFEEMESKLSGIVAVATYSYMQLCVKAEEMALLAVSFNIETEEKYRLCIGTRRYDDSRIGKDVRGFEVRQGKKQEGTDGI